MLDLLYGDERGLYSRGASEASLDNSESASADEIATKKRHLSPLSLNPPSGYQLSLCCHYRCYECKLHYTN